MADPISDVQNWFQSGAQWAWQQITGAFNWVGQQIQSLFGGVINAIRDAFVGFINSLGRAFGDIINAVADPFRALFAGFSEIIRAGVQNVTAFAGGNPVVAMVLFLAIPVMIVLIIALVIRTGRFAIRL